MSRNNREGSYAGNYSKKFVRGAAQGIKVSSYDAEQVMFYRVLMSTQKKA